MTSEIYEVLALNYGSLDTSWESVFLTPTDGSEAPRTAQLSYYFWLARSSDRVVLIDTGFDPKVAGRRGRETLVAPLDLLARAGVSPNEVTDVILTHFHYDHIGNARAFASATFICSQAEYDYWLAEGRETGGQIPVEAEELAVLSGLLAEGRMTLLPTQSSVDAVGGIAAMHLPGHTPGQIAVRIPTAGRDVIITSDAAHSAAEIELDLPFAVFTNIDDMKASMREVRRLADDGEAILVLGHEPSVMHTFPRWNDDASIVRISE